MRGQGRQKVMLDMDRGGSTGSLEGPNPGGATFKMGVVDQDDISSQAK
jgi:hypothetical protein